MKQGYLFLLTIPLFILSCNQSVDKPKKNRNLTDLKNYDISRKWYYEDGTLRKVQELNEKGEPTGVYKYYYPSGVLEDSAYLIKNEFHGSRYEFDKSGNLSTVSYYWRNSARNGLFYRSDNTLSYYRCYGYAEDLLFLIEYDENGKFKRTDGYPIYQWFGEDTVKIGEKFKQELLVANPPHSRTKFTAYEIDDRGNKERILIETEPDEFNRIRYSVEQDPNEDKRYLNVVEIYDSTTQKKIVDKMMIKFYKSGKTSFERL
jgi:hypothetical protein